nr:MAG TPA: hypothetical protein [Caudoviricetes sp.]
MYTIILQCFTTRNKPIKKSFINFHFSIDSLF